MQMLMTFDLRKCDIVPVLVDLLRRCVRQYIRDENTISHVSLKFSASTYITGYSTPTLCDQNTGSSLLLERRPLRFSWRVVASTQVSERRKK